MHPNKQFTSLWISESQTKQELAEISRLAVLQDTVQFAKMAVRIREEILLMFERFHFRLFVRLLVGL